MTDKTGLFDRLIKSLSVALTNSALYTPTHPVFISSVKLFKDALDECLAVEENAVLVFTPDNIMLNGALVKETSSLYAEVAGYVHKKGIMEIAFARGAAIDEVTDIFKRLKDGAAAREMSTAHIRIREVDYSQLLTSAKASKDLDDKEIWKSLSEIGKDLKKGPLPGSKSEFMDDFLKDPKKAASVLNRIYKDALAKLNSDSAVGEMRDVFSALIKHLDERSSLDAEGTKAGLADIISKLDPGLVASLFQGGPDAGSDKDLSGELFKDFSDEMMADFIASMMQNENNVNDNTIKLFNRLVSGSGDPGSVVPILTDKLFEKKLLGQATLSGLQKSIKDLFKNNPENEFVFQIYNMTVGSFAEKGAEDGSGHGKYSALAREYTDCLKDENVKKEKIRLLLNVLWLETRPQEFKKICRILAGSFQDICKAGYIGAMKEVFDFLTNKLGPKQRADKEIMTEVQAALEKISSKETVDRLIALIPGSSPEDLDDISLMFGMIKGHSAKELFGLFVNAADQSDRDKFAYLLSMMSGEISKEEKLAMVEALEAKNDAGVRKKVLEVLLKFKDVDLIDMLFERTRKGPLKSALPDLIALCGTYKVHEAAPYLGRILSARHFIESRSSRELKVQSVLSLGRIGTDQALECVRQAERDKNETVRKMCRLVLMPGAEDGKKAGS